MIRKRVPAFTAALLTPFLCLAQDVVINEIHYDPDDKTVPAEFIELHNPGEIPADLSLWRFSEGIFFEFEPGTFLDPGGYIIICEDPDAFLATFGAVPAPVLGPWEGRLANDGETVTLRNRDGERIDEVDYRVGFPWPIASRGRGASMELIHPLLDNDLGGSWKASGIRQVEARPRRNLIGSQDEGWHYRKGSSEASNPTSAWRQIGFQEDATWAVGQTSIGYGDGDDNTTLGDMQNSYSSVFLRREFTIANEEDLPDRLRLGVYSDDGAIAWLNGFEIGRFHVSGGDKAFDDFADSHEAGWDEASVSNPASRLQVGQNVLAIHAFNTTLGSSDFSIDAMLFEPGSDEETVAEPTPGAQNSVYSENAAPQIRQVAHEPAQPMANAPFVISARVTDPDRVAEVYLEYQVVPPGDYLPAYLPLPHSTLLSSPSTSLPRNPDYDDPANWTRLDMNDAGLNGDLLPGDDTYSATIPGQANRSLVRYRIIATDLLDASVRAPFPDDDSLNFACFVYDGVPAYRTTRRTVHPDGVGHVYLTSVTRRLPVHHLITRNADLMHCIAYDSSFRISKGNEGARDKFNWEGAVVHEGEVYDHIRYRLRQANDRYGGSGKRSMRFRFNRGNLLRARDNYGRPFPHRWRTLNTGKMFDNKRVGNFGLTEAMNANLWNLAGIPSPWFFTFHLRVIDGPQEAPGGPDGQYQGDFWGMFSGIENYDPIYLDTHQLEDGNLYKLKDGQFNGNNLRRNQGRFAVTTDADFQNIRSNLRPERTDQWLDDHVNYERWYPYHTVVEAVRHYDFRPADSHSKNRAWYFEPDYTGSPFGRLWTMPWDSDASWGPNWNSGVDYTKNAIFGGSGKPFFKQRYRNFIREFRDLVWTPAVINTMIDDLADFVLEFSKADRDRWRSAPSTEGSQDFGPIETKIRDMKNFAFVSWSGSTGPTVPAGGRAAHLDGLANAEGDSSRIPNTPTLSYIGRAGFPIDDLRFRCGAFSDPQGNGSFAAMKWRFAEISHSSTPGFDPTAPKKWEWEADWESEELTVFDDEAIIPPAAAKVGHRYRARVRMMDSTNRWSHWSSPVEFTVGPPSGSIPQIENLRITEIMYNPVGGSDFEFLELQNVGSSPLDLTDVRFDDGIEFAFADAGITTLEAGAFVVLVEDLEEFSRRYDTTGLLIAQYGGRLDNDGERVELIYGGNLPILDFVYSDTWYPESDGGGFSLRVIDPLADAESWKSAELWQGSSVFGGTPGEADFAGVTGGLQLPGDGNQDSRIDIGDAFALLLLLFRAESTSTPCEGASVGEGGNVALLDYNDDASVDSSDVIHLLHFLFAGGPQHVLGTRCTRVEGCPSVTCLRS